MVNVKTVRELVDAWKVGISDIALGQEIAEDIIAIKKTPSSSWLTALGFVSFSAFSLQISEKQGKTGQDISSVEDMLMQSPGAKIAIKILGEAAIKTAIALALEANGIGILFDLRLRYEIVSSADGNVVLKTTEAL